MFPFRWGGENIILPIFQTACCFASIMLYSIILSGFIFQTAYCVRPSETFILYYMHSILLTGLLQRLLLALAALALIGGVYFWAVGA